MPSERLSLRTVVNGILALLAIAFVIQLIQLGEYGMALFAGLVAMWLLMILLYLDAMAGGGSHA